LGGDLNGSYGFSAWSVWPYWPQMVVPKGQFALFNMFSSACGGHTIANPA